MIHTIIGIDSIQAEMVSTENGPKSRKKRPSSGKQVKGETETYSNIHYDSPRSLCEGDHHVYDVVRPRDSTYANSFDSAVYENLEDVGDVQTHYENMTFDMVAPTDDHIYLNVEVNVKNKKKSKKIVYDVPRSSLQSIYDRPSGSPSAGVSTVYDYPKGLIPLSSRLLLDARKDTAFGHDDVNCDADSLDGDHPSHSGTYVIHDMC